MKLNTTNKIVYKTSDYETFNFPDNFIYREAFYDYLKESISQKNLLIDCPILIDNNFNIVDGCYRVLVAKSLGIELFYRFTENKRIDHINIKEVRDKVFADDYLIYYKDNINYRILASKMELFSKYIPKRTFLKYMGVDYRDRPKYSKFKVGEFLFTDEKETMCNNLHSLLIDFEWTKEPFNAIKTLYNIRDLSLIAKHYLDIFNMNSNYIEKYKNLLLINKIEPQFDLLLSDLSNYNHHKPLSSKNIITEKFIYEGQEYENIITFQTLMLIDQIYETSDTLIQI